MFGVCYRQSSPNPNITTLSPSQRTAGAPAFTLTLTGSQFCMDVDGGSVITFNGTNHAAFDSQHDLLFSLDFRR